MTFPSAKLSDSVISNLFLHDMPGRTDCTEGWSRSGYLGWGHLREDFCCCFWKAGPFHLTIYTSHWVWLLGCSFGLDRKSQYKLRCDCAHWKESSRFIPEEITTVSIPCPAETGMELRRRITSLQSTGTVRSTMFRTSGNGGQE